MAFLQAEFGRVGADTHLTPREVIRDFVELLDILFQNPQLDAADLLGSEQFQTPVAAPRPAPTRRANMPAEAVAPTSLAAAGQGHVSPAQATPRQQDEFAEFKI